MDTPANEMPAKRQTPLSRKLLGVLGWRQHYLRRETFEKRPWLVSLCFHTLLVGVMACIVVERHGQFHDQTLWGMLAAGNNEGDADEMLNSVVQIEAPVPREVTEEPTQLHEMVAELEQVEPKLDALESVSSGKVTEEVVEEEPPPEVETPIERPKQAPKPNRGSTKKTGKSNRSPVARFPDIAQGRHGPAKERLLDRFGGTAKTEAAVSLGLKWLAQQQKENGSWSLSGPYADGMRNMENQEAATSMALLAFFGAGETHESGEYKSEIHKALQWLIYQQKKTGSFGSETSDHHKLYTHAQATLALSEGYLLTKDPWLKGAAQRAVNYAVKAQSPEGGWRYDFHKDSDTSVTGWMVQALVSGRSAYLEIPDKTFQKVSQYLDSVEQDYGTVYSYKPGRPPTPSMTAEGLLCRMYLGWPRTNTAIDASTDRLMIVAPFRGPNQSYYYWYYATQVMHHAGGDHWKQWNEAMRDELPALQVKNGKETGSWSPYGQHFDQSAGRLYTTCMAMYCLEVYYRHLPIYDSPWGEFVTEAKPGDDKAGAP